MNEQAKEKWLFLPLVLFAAMLSFVLTELSLFISGLVIVFFTAKYGIKYTVWGLFLLFFAGYLKNGPLMGGLLCAHALSAYVIGACIYEKKKFSFMLILGTALEVSVLTGYVVLLSNAMNYRPADFLFGESLRYFMNVVTASGQFDTVMIANLQTSIQFISAMLQSMLPGLFLSVALFYVYILFVITRFFLGKQKMQIETMPHFHELWLPKSISGILVVLFLISFFYASPVLANTLSFVFMLHVICGISVADHFMRVKGIPGGIRALIVALLIAFSSLAGGLLTSILCCIGMSDASRGIRR